MKRLDVLKMELDSINNLHCLSFNVKEAAQAYYEHEIECIEKYGSPNPEYAEIRKPRRFYDVDLSKSKTTP